MMFGGRPASTALVWASKGRTGENTAVRSANRMNTPQISRERDDAREDEPKVEHDVVHDVVLDFERNLDRAFGDDGSVL